MKIENYSFGEMKIEGRPYTSDLKIINGQITVNWWRKEGHSLTLEDIKDVLNAGPKTFVMGCGYASVLKVPHQLKEVLSQKGIKIIDVPTKKAVDIFNSSPDLKKTAFGFHLTC